MPLRDDQPDIVRLNEEPKLVPESTEKQWIVVIPEGRDSSPYNFATAYLCERRNDEHRGVYFVKKAQGEFSHMRDMRDQLNGDKSR